MRRHAQLFGPSPLVRCVNYAAGDAILPGRPPHSQTSPEKGEPRDDGTLGQQRPLCTERRCERNVRPSAGADDVGGEGDVRHVRTHRRTLVSVIYIHTASNAAAAVEAGEPVEPAPRRSATSPHWAKPASSFISA